MLAKTWKILWKLWPHCRYNLPRYMSKQNLQTILPKFSWRNTKTKEKPRACQHTFKNVFLFIKKLNRWTNLQSTFPMALPALSMYLCIYPYIKKFIYNILQQMQTCTQKISYEQSKVQNVVFFSTKRNYKFVQPAWETWFATSILILEANFWGRLKSWEI